MPGLTYWLLLHGILAAVVTWLARRYALHRDLLDHPGDRRSHQVPTPRGGGIAIVIAILLACGWLIREGGQESSTLSAFGIGLLLVAGVGWWDDHRPLSPWFRLLIHALAGGVLGAGFYVETASIWQALFAFGAVLVLVNVWNFMDGINGLAVSQAALAALAFACLLQGAWAWVAAALLAACLGFLPSNFPRARIFLGDVGSGAVGFVLAALLASSWSMHAATWLWLSLPLLAFLIDASLTLLSRIRRGARWWEPHVEHAYQVASRHWGHTVTTFAYAAFTAASLSVTLILVTRNTYTAIVAIGFLVIAGTALWTKLRKGVRVDS